MSVYIPVVVVLFLSQEESVVSALAVASGGFGLGLWASRRAVTWSEWGSIASLWLTIYGLSLSIGRALRRASLQREQQHRDELAAQRRRIAAELHDTVAHDLTLMVFRAESARRSLETAPAELARIASCGRRANEQLRFMMRLLQVEEFVRPSSLKETVGEVQQELAAEGIAVTISIDGSLGAINDRIGDCLARVLKEAGNNVIRHADRGYPCSIFVEVRQDEVHVAVRNRRSLPGRAASYGLGLDGMAQRLDMVNGTLRAGPQGTMWLVAATVPLVD
ncbi:sensor histidine kinase [Luteococcus sp. OSA5]|uniref:sensor histidine kinase n=1 Tax=Luteococcus sp. OSA5 TaxID=3401630 RepID=UPI003B43189C